METFRKLAPFMLRARVVEVGRERLLQIRNRLAFLIVTPDLSENSLNQILNDFKCPVYQCLSSEEIEELFGLRGTKIIGFHRSPLSVSVAPDLKPFLLARE